MANLLQTIRQNSQPQEQGVTDETQKLQTLLRAKSGKALAGPGVVSSNLGEQQAVANTNQQIQQEVAPQAAIQNAGLEQQQAGIQQQEQQQRSDIAQSRRFDTLQTRIKTDQILSDLERNKGKIDLARDGARLEQLGSNLRLENQKYVQDLQREGSRARLNDELAFREATARATMGNNMEIMNKSIDNNTFLKANDRDFKRKVAQIDIGSAYQMFNNEIAAGKQQAMWSGLGSLAKAGVNAASDYEAAPKKTTAAKVDTSSGGYGAQNTTTNKWETVG